MPQGGLEFPCILNFSTDDVKESDKTQKLVKASLPKVSVMDSTEIQNCTVSIKLEHCEEKLQNSCMKPHIPQIWQICECRNDPKVRIKLYKLAS